MNALISKAAEPARWLIVVGIAYTLATTALSFFTTPGSQQPAAQSAAQPTGPASNAGSRASDVNLVLKQNLFGKAGASRPVVRDRPAVETRLPLQLQGVFVAEIADKSAAIVAQKGKPGILYAINDSIPGNATLVEVHADHIVLRRAGAREQLKFPDAKMQFVPDAEGRNAPNARQQADARFNSAANLTDDQFLDGAFADEDDEFLDEEFLDEEFPDEQFGDEEFADENSDEPTARELVDSYSDLIDEDPQAALDELGISAVQQGSPSGYRLGNLAQSPYLSQTGLQSGDVILSINGRPVGDVQRDQQELQSVLAEGSARLEVQRGNRRFFVTASLK